MNRAPDLDRSGMDWEAGARFLVPAEEAGILLDDGAEAEAETGAELMTGIELDAGAGPMAAARGAAS